MMVTDARTPIRMMTAVRARMRAHGMRRRTLMGGSSVSSAVELPVNISSVSGMSEAEEDAAFRSGSSDSAIAEESEIAESPSLSDSPASGSFSSHRIGWMAWSLRLRGVPPGGSGGAPAAEGSLSASLAHVARSGHAAGCRGTWSSRSQCSGSAMRSVSSWGSSRGLMRGMLSAPFSVRAAASGCR